MNSLISDASWESAVSAVADLAAPKGGSDERGERARRAMHELSGAFVSADAWEITRGLMSLPEPVLRVVVAVGQILTSLIYSSSPRDRARRERLLNALLKEADAVSAERKAA